MKAKIDAIVSTDGDCLVLGAQCSIQKIDWGSEAYYEYNQGTVFEKVNGKFTYLLGQIRIQHWPMVATLLGIDYINNIPNIGPALIFEHYKKKMDEANTWSLDVLKKIGGIRSSSVTAEYWDTFEQFKNIFIHCPVLDADSVQIVPLAPFAEDDEREWVDIIGFDPIAGVLAEPNRYIDASLGNGCSFFHGEGD